MPQNGVHVAHDYASGGVRACRLGVRASARVTEALVLAAVHDMRDICIGVGEGARSPNDRWSRMLLFELQLNILGDVPWRGLEDWIDKTNF